MTTSNIESTRDLLTALPENLRISIIPILQTGIRAVHMDSGLSQVMPVPTSL